MKVNVTAEYVKESGKMYLIFSNGKKTFATLCNDPPDKDGFKTDLGFRTLTSLFNNVRKLEYGDG